MHSSPSAKRHPAVSRMVFDASAILAVAHKEHGSEMVLKHREHAIVSAVNHMEVASKLLRIGMTMRDTEIFLSEAFPNIIAFDVQQSNLAATLHAKHRGYQLSYADCACMALAMVVKIPVLTGDRKWADLALDMDVRLFR